MYSVSSCQFDGFQSQGSIKILIRTLIPLGCLLECIIQSKENLTNDL